VSLREAFALVAGRWFGDVYPAREDRPLPDYDARSHALRRLAEFLSKLDFATTGNVGEAPRAFQIPFESVHRGQPPDPRDLAFPSIAFIPSRGVHDGIRLGPARLVDETRDRYAPGTALLALGEYVEPFLVEAWGKSNPQRRALLAGVASALRLGQRSTALRLTLPRYYDLVASFSLVESQYVDDPDVIRGRMRGQLLVELRVPEVVLVDAASFRPRVTAVVQEARAPACDTTAEPL
jgi:hypothetical protein